MAVTKKRYEELLALVVKKYPRFTPKCLNTFGAPIITIPGSHRPVKFLEARRVERIPYCCGVVEIGGLYPLGKLDEADLAMFELWMANNCDLPFVAMCFIATTANSWHDPNPTDIERALFKSGWTPEHRGVNTIHGNHVTLWNYKNTPDSMYKEFGGKGEIFLPEGPTLDERMAARGERNAFA